MTLHPKLTSRPADGSRRGRPGLVLAVWSLLLVVFAGLAPVVQELMDVPFELLSVVMLAPALACLVLVVRPSWAPSGWPQVAWNRVLISVAIAIVAVAGFVVALALLTGRPPSWPSTDLGAPIGVFIAVQAIGVLSEELGWRGVVQRSGEQFARPAVVSAIAGFLFGATHLGYWSLGVLPVLTFAVTATLMSLTITTIFVGSLWQRMIPAVIIHLGLNLGLLALAEGDEPLAVTPQTLAATIVMLGVAAAVNLAIAARSKRQTMVSPKPRP